jgi:hypothetical protein
MFNQQVELIGLGDSAKNGLRGIARGFQPSNGRRAVYLYDEKRQISVKPENIKLVDTSIEVNEGNLCDLQCRLGTVSLLETIPTNRADVAKFLVQLGASIDVEDLDGVSARSMALAALRRWCHPLPR